METVTLEEANTEASTVPALGIFAGLSERARALLGGAGKFETLEPGVYLAMQGEPHHTMSFVISGSMNVYVHAHADTVNVATIGPGETVGEMNMIDDHGAASADVVVAEPARVFTIAREDFDTLVQREPGVGFEIIRALARELCHRLRKNSEMMLKQAENIKSTFRDMDY